MERITQSRGQARHRAAPKDTITEAVRLDFVDDEGQPASLDAEMVYDRHDPFAMRMVFKTAPTVTWTFARDLLLTGTYEPAGDGDVHVWPCVSAGGVAAVIFEFCSPDGQVLVQAGQRECARFGHRMTDLVPLGEEIRHVDLDATIEALLGPSADSAPDSAPDSALGDPLA